MWLKVDFSKSRASGGFKCVIRPRWQRAKIAESAGLRVQAKEPKRHHLLEAADRIAELTARAGTLEGEARELNNKAQAIEDAVYDLKAVNPNAKSVEDIRTPEELLDFIELKGREVAEALAALRRTAVSN
jgi:hypothetical protein